MRFLLLLLLASCLDTVRPYDCSATVHCDGRESTIQLSACQPESEATDAFRDYLDKTVAMSGCTYDNVACIETDKEEICE
jgi:hypothetical protein